MSYLGVTPPISTASPSPYEEEYNDELNTFLALHRVAECKEGNRKRNHVVDFLEKLFKIWVAEIGERRGLAEEDYKNGAGAKVFTFGSQRLNVHSPNSDIDILCCAPEFVNRYDFYSLFAEKLKALDNVTDILSLPEAYTPVVKLSFDSLSVDLVFVSIASPKLEPDINLLKNCFLKKLDEASIRSLNGVRVTESILQLVPNEATFCIALRAVKCWAVRRGVYSNVLGFLGGVNFAILVAFVCQRYPNSCPSTIIYHFFRIFSQWQWPSPVMLTNVEEIDQEMEPDIIPMPSWNPKLYPCDGHHLMPIITPAIPSMNSAFNVSIPQYRMLLLELHRGLFLFQSAKYLSTTGSNATTTVTKKSSLEEREGSLAGRSCSSSSLPPSILWNTLFTSSSYDFFHHFPRYIQIDILSHTREEHKIWFGWCESRLRQLFLSIEQSQMVYCHPNSNCFHRHIYEDSQSSQSIKEREYSYISSFFVGLSFPEKPRIVDVTDIITSFRSRVCSWVGKSSNMDFVLQSKRAGELPDYVYAETPIPSYSAKVTVSEMSQLEQNWRKNVPNSIFATPSRKAPARGSNSNAVSQFKESTVAPSTGTLQHSGSTPQLASLALRNKNEPTTVVEIVDSNRSNNSIERDSLDDEESTAPKSLSVMLNKQSYSNADKCRANLDQFKFENENKSMFENCSTVEREEIIHNASSPLKRVRPN